MAFKVGKMLVHAVIVGLLLAILVILDFLLAVVWTCLVIRGTIELLWSILCWLYNVMYMVIFT